MRHRSRRVHREQADCRMCHPGKVCGDRSNHGASYRQWGDLENDAGPARYTVEVEGTARSSDAKWSWETFANPGHQRRKHSLRQCLRERSRTWRRRSAFLDQDRGGHRRPGASDRLARRPYSQLQPLSYPRLRIRRACRPPSPGRRGPKSAWVSRRSGAVQAPSSGQDRLGGVQSVCPARYGNPQSRL
jgi:hypothetical protein